MIESVVRASWTLVPALGCVLGTSELGEPVDTSTTDDAATTSTSTGPVADDGASGMQPPTTGEGSTTTPADSAEGVTEDPSGSTSTETGLVTTETGCPGDDGCVETGGAIGCDTYAQDCLAGEKCNLWANDMGNSWNDTRCVPLEEQPTQVGDACTVLEYPTSGVDDCDVGLFCFPEESGEVGPWNGHCLPLCAGSEEAPSCPVTFGCFAALCFETCDPLASTCEPGFSCDGIVEGELLCLPGFEDGPAAGEPCAPKGPDCASGLTCVLEEDVPGGCGWGTCCTELCVQGGAPCPDGTECTSFGRDWDPAGACTVPP